MKGLKIDVKESKSSDKQDRLNILTLMLSGFKNDLPPKFLRVGFTLNRDADPPCWEIESGVGVSGIRGVYVQDFTCTVPAWRQEFGF